MLFNIAPLRGVGNIEFNSPREEVRRLVNAPLQSFKRSFDDPFPCDYYRAMGAFFYYDVEDRLEAIEFAAPARPTVGGLELLGLGFDEACASLRTLDSDVRQEIDGAIAPHLGVSVYAPLAKDDPAAPVESVLAFRPGYYD